MKTLTRKDLISDIRTNTAFSLDKAKRTAELLIMLIERAIYKRKAVYIPRVLRISSKVKEPRLGRDIHRNFPMTISRRHSITAQTVTCSNCEYGKYNKAALIADLTKPAWKFSAKEANVVADTFYAFIGKIKDGQHRIELRGLGVFYSKQQVAHSRPELIPNKRKSLLGKMFSNTPTIKVAESTRLLFRVSPSIRKAMDETYL